MRACKDLGDIHEILFNAAADILSKSFRTSNINPGTENLLKKDLESGEPEESSWPVELDQ